MLCRCDYCYFHYTEYCSKDMCKEQTLYLDEIMELAEYLEKYRPNYFYQIFYLHGGYQIKVYDDNGHFIFDAVCHDYSYGSDEGLLEIMGDIVNDDWGVESWLTAEDVIKRLEEKYGQ